MTAGSNIFLAFSFLFTPLLKSKVSVPHVGIDGLLSGTPTEKTQMDFSLCSVQAHTYLN